MDKKKNDRKSKLVWKRIGQVLFLLMMFAVLGVTSYTAVRATDFARKRAENEVRRSVEAASASAAAAEAAAAAEEDAEDAETVTEVQTTTERETQGFNIIDFFANEIFKSKELDEEDIEDLVDRYAYEDRIWMGDSRMVGVSRTAAVQGNDVFICKGAMAFDWFISEGVMQLEQELAQDPKRVVIINFGVNDCANNCAGWQEYFVEDYVEAINALIAMYPDTKFCFASVGLLTGDYTASGGRKLPMQQVNEFIDRFNDTMYIDCLAEYIDLSEYLVREGVVTFDGVHYDGNGYAMIYDYCVAKAGKEKK